MRPIIAGVLCVTWLAVVILPTRPVLAAPNLKLTEAPPVAVAAAPQALAPSERAYRKGRTLKYVGMAITLLGLAVAVAAIVPFALTSGSSDTVGDAVLRAIGGTMLAGAAVHLAVGIPLWVVGSNRMDRAVSSGYRPLAGGAFVSPTPGGMVAGLRLVSF